MKLSHSIFGVRQREPFITNKAVVTETRQVLLQLEWEGCPGLGTVLIGAAPKVEDDQVQTELDACAHAVASASPFELAKVNRQLVADAVPAPVIAGLNMAMHDLIGRVTGCSCRQILGLAALPLGPTALSLGAMPDQQLVERAGRHSDWPILKLKMTKATDVDVVRRVREVYAGRIWVDGNGCWDVDTAITASRQFAAWGVELLEQPIPSGHLEMMRTVRASSSIPIIADEDAVGPGQVVRLIGAADVIAIKLHRCGGLDPALEMIGIARACGLKVMLGCASESALGVTAIGQLAGLADYLDLDGSFDVADDPFIGISISEGRITLPDGPGLGVTRSAGSSCDTEVGKTI